MGGHIYLFKIFGKNLDIFFLYLAIRGNDFNFFFQYQQAKNIARKSKIDSKIDTFSQIDIRDFATLGVEKVFFWTFSKFL